jgi:MFS family permease
MSYFVETFLRTSASSLSPILIQELGISLGKMGFLITGFWLIYGIMQFPSAVLSDVLGPKRTIVGFTALTCVGCLLFYLSHQYDLLFMAQFIMGLGTSVFYINAITIINRWFPPERKATVIGILSASSGVGAFTCYMGFPLAETMWGGWRALYIVMLGVLLLNWGMKFLFLSDGPPQNIPPQKPRRNILMSFREVLVDRRFFIILFCYVMLTFNSVLNNWINPFLISAKGLTYVEAGVVSSLGTVAGFFGCITVGMISDRLRSRRLPVILFATIGFLLFGVMIFVPAGLNFAVYAGIWCAMGLFGSIWVLFFSMVGEVLPPEKAAIGLGLMNGLSIILSSFIAPIYGTLVDVTGGYFTPNIIVFGVVFFTILVIIIYTKETYGGIHSKI